VTSLSGDGKAKGGLLGGRTVTLCLATSAYDLPTGFACSAEAKDGV
jgi:hypothetical protein